MNNSTGKISLGTAALVAGLAILTMVAAAPFAELFVYPKLVIPGNAIETIKNITANKALFAGAILCYSITFICDIVAAWALFILLKPVNSYLSLLAGLFRWVYAAVAIAALLNLVTVFRLLSDTDLFKSLGSNQLTAIITLSLTAFRSGFHFSILFFGIHLVLLGYLVLRSHYIPWVLGLLLIITGLGYFTTSVQPLLFPNINVDFAKYTFYGELIFMLWLLIRGWKISESN